MRKERGSIILTVAVSLPVLVGMLGLAADVGRLYVAKNELQVFADSAALAACYELDGTAQGLANARSVAATGPGSGGTVNKWDFATKTVSNAQTSFAQTFNGAYSTNPATAAGYRFVRVQATGQVPLYFLIVLPNIPSSLTITATSIAGQSKATSIGNGVDPFSPDAHDPADPNFGFVVGQQYTLKWAPPGRRDKDVCAGDAGFTPGNASSDRGFIDVGQGNGNSGLYDAIVNGDYNLAQPLIIGSTINMVQGNNNVPPALDARVSQDTDTTAATYSAYHGNGRRIVIIPVNDHADTPKVAGFAGFFLPPSPCGKNNTPCCAEYVGPVLKYGKRKAAGGPGLYAAELFQ